MRTVDRGSLRARHRRRRAHAHATCAGREAESARGQVAKDPKRYQVSFLATKPPAELVRRLESAVVAPERLMGRRPRDLRVAPGGHRTLQTVGLARGTAARRDCDCPELDHGHKAARANRRVGRTSCNVGLVCVSRLADESFERSLGQDPRQVLGREPWVGAIAVRDQRCGCSTG